ncbi:MAG: hydantoinase/oxoprolinase family protein [Actinobacteria bacterium]|nr:hydantoinase/oxoprolinase family protein [Actinomycetota bacterium]
MLRIGIDIGGTFTDLTALEESGRAHLWKEPTTPADPMAAILTGLEGLAGSLDRPVAELLGEARLLVHGTTIATNTVIQRNGPRIGLLATKGFRDVLYFRDAWKPERFNMRFAPPEPFVERFLRRGVSERIGPAGQVVAPLDEDEVRRHAAYLGEHGVEAVAVAFLWSIVNPDHEHRAAAILREELPDAYVVCSADVVPEIREWERTSAAVLSAYVLPGIDAYFGRLKSDIAAAGLGEDPLIMQLNGGCAPIDEVLKRPVYALHSGPAAAPAAAAHHAGRRGLRDVITIDMGGTSFDVCLVREGRAARSRSIRVDQQPVGVEAVAVHSVGAGGGSIAYVDEGGALNVGPRSAGSVPGPAAYGAGGTEPTVTDANVVLGYLDPEAFLGGRRELRADLAEQAIAAGVGEPLGLDPVAAAAGVIRVVNASMTAAVRAVSVERGLDPRNFALVVGGGAGGLHASALARDLGIERVVIPREAGTLCAFGMTVTDVRHDYLQPLHCTSDSLDSAALDALYAGLEERGRARLGDDGFAAEEIRVERSVDARYPGQVYELTVAIPAAESYGPEHLAQIEDAFHAEHERQFGYRREELPVEFLHWRAAAVGRMDLLHEGAVAAVATTVAAAPLGERRVYVPALGEVAAVPLFKVEALATGSRVDGPAVVAGDTTTILLEPGDVLRCDEDDSFLIEVGKGGD